MPGCRQGSDKTNGYRNIGTSELGRLLDCDAVVFGRVTDFDSLYAAVYSRFSVGRGNRGVGHPQRAENMAGSHVANSHEGGVPLSLLEIPLVSIRSGLNLRETVRIHTVDELTRYLAQRVPSPCRRR
jgi:hypothetical protein